MRYYGCVVCGTQEAIQKLLKERKILRNYSYYEPIKAINVYMYQTLKNNIGFLAYRQQNENHIWAVFCFEERKETLEAVYDYIMNELRIAFEIKTIAHQSPNELTMCEFAECYQEAKRREFVAGYRFQDISNLFIYDLIWTSLHEEQYFEFQEKIIPEKMCSQMELYDKGFCAELSNIEQHSNHTKYSGNMVHYFISGRSKEAVWNMTERLACTLKQANRISGGRIEIISEIDPYVYKRDNYFEKIVENNYGGVVVFDLTEKFGCDPVEYRMVCAYIEKIVKRYKNECLFVFTYNLDHPGFSYYLLPDLQKFILPVQLREGTGDRKAAVNYLKRLIQASDYSQYANQAREFMKQFPGETFSQTDVIRAYEQFEPWCMNKNILQAYHNNLLDDFMLEREKGTESPKGKLAKMIGLESVKMQIDTIIATDLVEKERKKRMGGAYQAGTMHMIYAGNPGSAKTTVAKLFATIAKEEGILKSGAFVAYGGMDLDGFGCVSVIREAFMAAKGGVLFIDEAYSLKSDTAVTVLIQEMENHRDEVIVILAGYSDRMKAFMKINEGLKSRIPFWIDFPDYNAEELSAIFKLMIQERGFSITDDAVKEAHDIFEKICHVENFGNGRYVRNLLESAIQKQSVRLLCKWKCADRIRKNELFSLVKDDIPDGETEEQKETKRIGFCV